MTDRDVFNVLAVYAAVLNAVLVFTLFHLDFVVAEKRRAIAELERRDRERAEGIIRAHHRGNQ